MSRMLVVLLTLLLAAHAHADRWQPKTGLRWQIQFSGEIDTSFNVDVYVIDMFDSPKSLIDTLHAQGKAVVCYISAGSWENWRPDAGSFPKSVLGRNLSGWAGEKWLDIRQTGVLKPIMQARMDTAAGKGCDGIMVDNVDGYTYRSTGFPLKATDQLAYNRMLASEAHARNLAIGLNNDLLQIKALEPDYDFGINESCYAYKECGYLKPFADSGKAVLHIEYKYDLATFCPADNAAGYSGIRKHENLDAWLQGCL